MTRTRREKQPETREAVRQVLRRVGQPIFASDYDDMLDELLEFIQEEWEEESCCDIDEYDVARALRKLHADKVIRVWHRDPSTEEKVHSVRLIGAP